MAEKQTDHAQTPEIDEPDDTPSERFWIRRRIGGAILVAATMTALAPKVYAEGAKISEEQGQPYSIGQAWRDMRGPAKGQGYTRRDKTINSRLYIAGPDGQWRAGEQGVNDALFTGLMVGTAAFLKGAMRRDSRKDE